MFAISVRVRPCSDLCSFSSDERDTMTSPFSILMARSGWNVFFNSPLGPFTVTVVPSAVTFTPLGTLTGILPILDIVRSPRLPDHGQELAAGARLPRLAVGHQPLRRRQDRHAQAVANSRNLLDPHVLTQPGRRDTLQLANHRLSAGVLESHAQKALAVVRLDRGVVLNEVVLLQDARDLGFHTRH